MPDQEDHEEEKSKPKISDKIETALLESRRLFLSDAVMNESATELINKLWYLELKDPGKPILFIINSPGGSVDAGFALWDQIKMITSPVTTIVTGLAASMGSVLALVAPPERRFATPRARFMIHQPSIGGVIKGQATDLEIQAKEILKSRETLIELYMEGTGKDHDTIANAIDRDTWMSPEEAREFGLIKDIVDSYQKLKKKGLMV